MDRKGSEKASARFNAARLLFIDRIEKFHLFASIEKKSSYQKPKSSKSMKQFSQPSIEIRVRKQLTVND